MPNAPPTAASTPPGEAAAPPSAPTAVQPVPQPATPKGPSTDQLDRLRVDIADTIKTYFPWLFLLTVVVAVSLIVMIAVGFASDRTMTTTVLASSVQVAFGMVIGFVCVYIGLMMTWFGIDAAYTVKASLGGGDVKAEGALKSASPGLLFALSGIALIAVSLYKPIAYETQGLTPAGVRSFGNFNDAEPEPMAPKRPGAAGAAAPSAADPEQAPSISTLPQRPGHEQSSSTQGEGRLP